MLKIHNTLARAKQDFVPIKPGKVRIYVCGMTIYDLCHVATPALVCSTWCSAGCVRPGWR